MKNVWCCDCAHVEKKKGDSRYWLCMQAPRTGTGFVTKEFWDDDSPYERCNQVNRFGNCRWYEEEKDETRNV